MDKERSDELETRMLATKTAHLVLPCNFSLSVTTGVFSSLNLTLFAIRFAHRRDGIRQRLKYVGVSVNVSMALSGSASVSGEEVRLERSDSNLYRINNTLPACTTNNLPPFASLHANPSRARATVKTKILSNKYNNLLGSLPSLNQTYSAVHSSALPSSSPTHQICLPHHSPFPLAS